MTIDEDVVADDDQPKDGGDEEEGSSSTQQHSLTLERNDIWLDASARCDHPGTQNFHKILQNFAIEDEDNQMNCEESKGGRIAQAVIVQQQQQQQQQQRWLIGPSIDRLRDVSKNQSLLHICIYERYQEIHRKQKEDVASEMKEVICDIERDNGSCSSLELKTKTGRDNIDCDSNDDDDLDKKRRDQSLSSTLLSEMPSPVCTNSNNHPRATTTTTTTTTPNDDEGNSFCHIQNKKMSIAIVILLLLVLVAVIVVPVIIVTDTKAKNNSNNSKVQLDLPKNRTSFLPKNRTSLFTGGLIWPNNNSNGSSTMAEQQYPIIKVKVWNAMDESWQPLLKTALKQWDDGSPTIDIVEWDMMPKLPWDPVNCDPIDGNLKLCNGDYGLKGWRGYTGVMVNTTTREILSAVIQINDFYYANREGSYYRKLYTLCHELGHGLGLPHTDENPFNDDLDTCMDYTLNHEENAHPNESNFQFLASLYSNSNVWNINNSDEGRSSSSTDVAADGNDGDDTHGRRLRHRQRQRLTPQRNSLSRILSSSYSFSSSSRVLLESNGHSEVHWEPIDDESGLISFYLLDY